MRLRTRARLRWQGRTVAVLTLVWLLLWGHVNLVTVLSGVLVGYLVTVVFPLPAIPGAGRLHLFGVLQLSVRVLYDLVRSSFDIARASLRPTLRLEPGIVRVDLTTTSDLVQVLTAAMLSIVPGSIVVEAPRQSRRLYLHIFDLSGPDAAERERKAALRVENRVLRAFGSDEEIARSNQEIARTNEAIRKAS